MLSPLAKQIKRRVARMAPTAPATMALINRILLIARVDIAVLFLVIADMVTKPFG